MSLRTAVELKCDGQGFLKCNCSGSNKCQTNRCNAGASKQRLNATVDAIQV